MSAKKKPEEAPPEERPVNGVVVTRAFDPNGAVRAELSLLGDVKATEAQTLLELGIKQARRQLGLSEE